jgi:hypothetical protein
MTVPDEHPDTIAGAVQRHIQSCDHPWCRATADR